MLDDAQLLPQIADLHERHHGLTEAVSRYFAEGMAICMQRHHTSPVIINVSADAEAAHDYLAHWEAPTERQMAAWSNSDDATRDAAYGIVIAAAEAHLGLFVISRAEPGSGSDYLMSAEPYDSSSDAGLSFEDLQVSRLEVSGTNVAGGNAQLESLARGKVEQLRRGASLLPGMAGVVAFNLARVRFRRI